MEVEGLTECVIAMCKEKTVRALAGYSLSYALRIFSAVVSYGIFLKPTDC